MLLDVVWRRALRENAEICGELIYRSGYARSNGELEPWLFERISSCSDEDGQERTQRYLQPNVPVIKTREEIERALREIREMTRRDEMMGIRMEKSKRGCRDLE
jgi:succinate dehydrogenase/fumarate reductase flavoprotein subunit